MIFALLVIFLCGIFSFFIIFTTFRYIHSHILVKWWWSWRFMPLCDVVGRHNSERGRERVKKKQQPHKKYVYLWPYHLKSELIGFCHQVDGGIWRVFGLFRIRVWLCVTYLMELDDIVCFSAFLTTLNTVRKQFLLCWSEYKKKAVRKK